MSDRRDAATDDLTSATRREIAIALYAADALLVDFTEIEDAVDHARRVFNAVDTDPTWANGRHEGDCTQAPMTCQRCLVEEFEEKAEAFATSEELVCRV